MSKHETAIGPSSTAFKKVIIPFPSHPGSLYKVWGPKYPYSWVRENPEEKKKNPSFPPSPTPKQNHGRGGKRKKREIFFDSYI